MYPCFAQSFPNESTAEVFRRSMTLTNKSNSLTYTVASSLVCTSPLAVITVVGFLDIFMVFNSAELRSFSLIICTLAPESTTNFFSSGSFVDTAGSTHSVSFSLTLCWQDSKACYGHIALVFQSSRGTDPRILQRGDFADVQN